MTLNNNGVQLDVDIGDREMEFTDDMNLGMTTPRQFIPKEKENPKQKETIFILCDSCLWSATFFGNMLLPEGGRCPNCQNTELSSFPILPNESFVINHGGKRGVELRFIPRKQKRN